MVRKLLLILGVVIAAVVVLAIAAVVLIDPDDYREEIAERASETLGREVRLDGPMSLKLFPWLALEISDVHVGNPPGFGEAAPLAEVGRAIASVRVWPLVRGDMEIGAITLADAELNLVTNRAGDSNLAGLLAEPAADQPTAEPDLSQLVLGAISLDNVSLIQIDLGRQTRSEFHIDQLQLDPFRADQPVAFQLNATVRDQTGDQLIVDSLAGQMTVAANLTSIAVDRMDATFSLPGGDVTGQAQGRLQVSIGNQTRLSLPAFSVEVTSGDMDLGLALTEPLDMVLADTMEVALEGARLSLNDQDLTARGRVRLGDDLRAELTLAGQTLDLRALMPESGSQSDETTEAGQAPTDFQALQAFDVEFGLTLDTLILSDAVTLSQVSTQARLVNGVLVLAPMNAQLLGGSFDGRVEVDFNQSPPRVAMQPRLNQVLVEQLAALSGAAAPLSGLGDFSLDMTFSGLDLASILASLNGRGQFTIEGGALEGVDLRRLIDEKLTTSNLGNVSQAFGGRTEFDTFGASLEASNGVIELPDINLAAGSYGVSGRGRIDFAADLVDYRLDLNLGSTLTEQLPRTLRDATNGRIPLAITGPVSQPTVTVDLSSLAERAVRQQIQDRLLRPREERESDEPTDGDPQGETDGDGETGTSADESEQAEPETRERTSQMLLRGLLERRRDDEDADAEEDDETDPEDPPIQP